MASLGMAIGRRLASSGLSLFCCIQNELCELWLASGVVFAWCGLVHASNWPSLMHYSLLHVQKTHAGR